MYKPAVLAVPAHLLDASHQLPAESVLSSMFLVIGSTMFAVARWAIAVRAARLRATTKRLWS